MSDWLAEDGQHRLASGEVPATAPTPEQRALWIAPLASLRARLAEGEQDAERWRFVRSKLSDGGTCYMPGQGRRHCSVRLQTNIGAWFPNDGSEVSPDAIVDAARLTPPEPT